MSEQHEHQWIDATRVADHVARFICRDCGAVRHEPRGPERRTA